MGQVFVPSGQSLSRPAPAFAAWHRPWPLSCVDCPQEAPHGHPAGRTCGSDPAFWNLPCQKPSLAVGALVAGKTKQKHSSLSCQKAFFVGGGECFNLHSVALLLFSCPLSPSPCSKDGAGLIPDSCGAEGDGNAAQPGLTFAWAPKFPGSGCGSLVSPGALLRAGIPQPFILLTLTAGLAQ